MNSLAARLFCLSAALGGLAACSNDATPYTDEAAAIDPAMQPQTDTTHPTATADPPSDAMPEPDETPKTDPPPAPPEKVELTDEQWRSILSDEEFYVLRRSGTERPGTHKYNHHPKDKKGAFHCVGCGNKLYDAKHKFHSGCGWPSFNQEVEPGAITEHRDVSLGMVRLEMRCARCDGHLGHIFEDGHLWDQETGLRHCVNGTALIFIPEGEDPQDVIRKHREEHAHR